MQRQLTFGGGVSPRNTRLRGQSIIEYVLIIAVIGLVIVFAGPGVAGAIRNQFNQVTNTVDSGTEGDNFMSAEEKAYCEAMKTVAQKDAKDWTLDEQKAAATDIAKNGTSSVVYAKAKAAMDTGTTWSVKLTNGKTLTYRIIGINHDDLADGSGKAGLTFEFAKELHFYNGDPYGLPVIRMTSSTKNQGGWEHSELRKRLNSGDINQLIPEEIKAKACPVTKMTDNQGGGKAGVPSATTDNFFILSVYETLGCQQVEGCQYEYYKAHKADNEYGPWTRSVYQKNDCWFMGISRNGDRPLYDTGSSTGSIRIAFCF